jgi:hypothetical protein
MLLKARTYGWFAATVLLREPPTPNFFSVSSERTRAAIFETSTLGAGGLEFKSPRPDHLLLCFQFALLVMVSVGA